MCLIIHRPTDGKRGKGSNVPTDVLRINSRMNPDGFGIAWRENGGLRFEKFAPGDYERFEERVRAIDRIPTIEYVAHFRKATHGPACLELSHPFAYEDAKEGETLVFHNGIIDINTDARTESDTSAFVDRILTGLRPRWWTDKALKYLVEGAIGWSRLLVMTANETVRLNEKAWRKEGGIWYSTSPRGYSSSTSWSNGSAGYQYPKGGYAGYAGREGWYGDSDDEDDEEEAEAIALLAPTVGRRDGDEWVHMGHVVHALSAEADEVAGDVTGQVVCESCKTIGEYYRISGSIYVDLAHADTEVQSEAVKNK